MVSSALKVTVIDHGSLSRRQLQSLVKPLHTPAAGVNGKGHKDASPAADTVDAVTSVISSGYPPWQLRNG
jgi:hypothetical protein